MEQPLVSIIMPIYNVEQFVESAIQSVIEQTYTNLEILLIDDGATDTSGEIANLLAQTDQRVNVYHKANGGLSDSRNYGLKRATGEYIYFPDSDDVLHPSLITDAIAAIENQQADIFCGNFQLVNEAGKAVDGARKRGAINEVLCPQAAIELILDNKLDNYIWQFVYRRSLLVDMKFEFVKNLLYEDIIATPELLLAAKRIVFSDKVLYDYRIRNNSIVHSMSLKKIHDIEYVVDHFTKLTIDQKIGSDDLRRKWRFPLLMSIYLGLIKYPGEVDKMHLKEVRNEIVASKQTNLTNKEKLKFFLIKTNLIKLTKYGSK